MLSLDQIDWFHATGVLLDRQVIIEPELANLQKAADKVVAEAVKGDGEGHWRLDPEDPQSYFRSERMLDRGDVFAAAAVNPALLRRVGQCLADPFMLLNDALITKLPRSPVEVKWHQDPPYQGPTGRTQTFGYPNFVVDIYLDASTRESGCIYAFPGQHLRGRVELESKEEAELYNDPSASPILADLGDISFHALSVPHGSHRNMSARPRRILLFHYVTANVYENDYSDWMTNYGGFGPEAAEYLRQAIKTRERLYGKEDWTDLDFSEEGVRYTGNIVRPADCWARKMAHQDAVWETLPAS